MNNDLNPIQFQQYEQNINLVKNYFRKPLLLIISILFFLNCISITFTTIIVPDFSSKLFSSFSLIDPPESAFLQSASNVLSLIMYSIPFILILLIFGISFLLIYLKSKNSNSSVTPSLGLRLLRILSIVVLIILSVFFVIYLTAIIFSLLSSPDTLYSNISPLQSSLRLPFILLLSIECFICLVYILYYIFMLRFVSGIKQCMNSPDINYKGCQALSVLSIIRAAFEFISIALSVYLLISSYISLSSIEYIYIFSIIGSALALARFILISKLSTGWKKDVIYIKTAHLRDYNDGYDIHSIFNIDNIPEPVQYESPGELSIPSWDVIDESVPAEQPQNITPTTAPATDITENNTNKSDAVQCPSCHSLMTTEDKFCTNCGQKLI